MKRNLSVTYGSLVRRVRKANAQFPRSLRPIASISVDGFHRSLIEYTGYSRLIHVDLVLPDRLVD
jgi:hypothetical protein